MTAVPTPDALLAFAIASLVLFLIPGAAVADIVNRAVVAGLELGNFVHVIAATVGLSAFVGLGIVAARAHQG